MEPCISITLVSVLVRPFQSTETVRPNTPEDIGKRDETH